MKKQNKKKNIIAAALAIVLAAALMIGATFSLYYAKADETTNTYEGAALTVAFNNGDSTYTIIPGETDADDLAVEVTTSVNAYVFLVVEDNTENLVTYSIDTDYWTKLSTTDSDSEDSEEDAEESEESEETEDTESGSTGEATESSDGSMSIEYSFPVFENESVSYSSDLTNSDIAGKSVTLVFNAYAVYTDSFADAESAYNAVVAAESSSDETEDAEDETTEDSEEAAAEESEEETESEDAESETSSNTTVYYHVITVDEDAEVTSYTVSTADGLNTAITNLTGKTGTITLASDISLASTVEITGSDTAITLDLGEYNLTNTSGTALSVTDASVTIEGSGTISGDVSDENETTNQGGAIYINGGTVEVDGATITGTAGSASYCAGAVYVTNGTFTFTSGTIKSSTASGYAGTGGVYLNASIMTMGENAMISNCGNTNKYASTSSYVTGAVRASNGSTFTMTGGTITDCYISNSSSKVFGTGGVLVCGASTFNMSGGTITSCTGSCGGAVIVFNSGSAFNMSGGSITSNTATYSGGAMYIYDSGAFIMNGGSITSNACTYSTGKGGGIRACSGTTVTLTGGTISGNTAANGNDAYIDSGCTLNDSGSILTDYYDGNSAS